MHVSIISKMYLNIKVTAFTVQLNGPCQCFSILSDVFLINITAA